jgi:hypothetical protein
MITAVTALVVALLSAGTSLYGTRASIRLQRELHKRQTVTAAQSERSTAYTTYCSAAALFIGACWELAQELILSTRDGARCTEKYSIYEERWNNLAAARTPARTQAAHAKDAALALALDVLIQRVGALGDMTSMWYHELRKRDWQTDTRRPNNLQQTHSGCWDALAAFENEVARIIGLSRAEA